MKWLIDAEELKVKPQGMATDINFDAANLTRRVSEHYKVDNLELIQF